MELIKFVSYLSLYIDLNKPLDSGKLITTLITTGFAQNVHVCSLFTLNKPEGMVIVLVYVDDLLITGNNEPMISEAKEVLHRQFKLKGLGEAQIFSRD